MGQVYRDPVMLTEVQGWVGSPNGPPQLAIPAPLDPAAPPNTRTDIVLTPATDLAAANPTLTMRRFLISTTCAPAAMRAVGAGRRTAARSDPADQPARADP